jgi:hypothetical protein
MHNDTRQAPVGTGKVLHNIEVTAMIRAAPNACSHFQDPETILVSVR